MIRCTPKSALAAVACALLASLGHSQAGTLDDSFGVGGKVLTDIQGPGLESPIAPAISARRNDGKVVVAGYAYSADQLDRWFVARFLADGTPDPSFGANGWITTVMERVGTSSVTNQIPVGVALDGSAAIVVGIDRYRGIPGGLNVMRVLDDGSLDPAFGVGGKVRVRFAGPTERRQWVEPCGVSVANGRTLIGFRWMRYDESIASWRDDFAVAALAPDGTLDPSYGVGGVATADLSESDSPRSLVPAPDGSVTLVGYAYSSTTTTGVVSIGLARFDPNGAPDLAFGSGGQVLTTGALSSRYFPSGAVATPDGGVAVLMQVSNEPYLNTDQMLVVRYGPDGALQGSFPVAPTESDLAVQPDGAVVTLEVTHDSAWRLTTTVRRYLQSGAPDASFGSAGAAAINLSTDFNALSVDIAPDGSLLVTGTVRDPQYDDDVALVRLSAQGTLDAGFGGGRGYASVDVQVGQVDYARDLAVLQGDGKLLVLGNSQGVSYTANYGPVLLRYNPDGSLDGTFGFGGTQFINPTGATGVYWEPTGLAIQSTGRILVAANSGDAGPNPDQDLMVVGLDSSGMLDPTFGSAGFAFLDQPDSYEYAEDMVVLPDDRILILGQQLPYPHWSRQAIVARLLSDGTVDTAFGVDGVVTLTWGAAGVWPSGLALAPDGRVVVSAAADDSATGAWRGLLAFVAPNGVTSGLMDAGIPGGYQAVAVDSVGRTIVAFTVPSTYGTMSVARFLPSGALDTAFGAGGIATASVPSLATVFPSDVLVQGDLKVVLAGYGAAPGAYGHDFAVARLNVDGSPDLGFGTSGGSSVDFGCNDVPVAAAIQGDGAIVVAGTARCDREGGFNAGAYDIALARFHGITTPDVVISELVPVVQQYVDGGLLTHTSSTALQKKLEASLQQVEKGNDTAAVNQLNAFINEVNALVSTNRLSAGNGAYLTNWVIVARTLILAG